MQQGPDYLSALFPRDRFPQYGWKELPPGFPRQVWTTETTHRDGQQGGLPLTTAQSIRIYEILCRFTGSSGAIRQAEFFVYRESDRRALREAVARHQEGAPIEPTTWIRASEADAALIAELGVRETGMLASVSDFHTFHKFNPGGREPAAGRYLQAVARVLDAGIRPRLHLEDATRAPLDFLLELVDRARGLAAAYPTEQRPKFRVCDTLGVGLPDPDVPVPRSVPGLFDALRRAGVASEDLEFHPHNDTGLIVANSLAALRHGCGVINGTCLGKGERTGNAPLEMILFHLLGMGYFEGDKPDYHVLNELAAYYEEIGFPVAPQYPLFGRDAHLTRAGIHADGLNKNWWMYAPFNVPALIGRELEVALTADSGAAGILYLANRRLGRTLKKQDPEVREALAWIEDQFARGRQTAVAWEEIAHCFEAPVG